MKKNLFKNGFTLFETLIVLAIIGVLALIALPQFSKIKENQLLKSTVSDVLSAVDNARSKTLSSLNSSEYGVHFQADRIIIFKGKVFSSGATDNEILSIETPINISNVTLGGVSSTSGDVYFNRLSGSPSTTGTVTIYSPSFSKVITISATGTAN
jgi:prepilin-type N-terminal cleavage/methylation domain-containing protein